MRRTKENCNIRGCKYNTRNIAGIRGIQATNDLYKQINEACQHQGRARLVIQASQELRKMIYHPSEGRA